MSNPSASLGQICRAHKHDFDQRVATVEGAVAAIASGTLDHALRASAERDSHKLAGSLGTFGLQRGTELARELETVFAPGRPPVDAIEGPHLSECIAALRDELEGELTRLNSGESSVAVAVIATRACVVDVDGHEQAAHLRRDTFEPGLAGTQPLARRILVVDDNEAVRDVLVAMLSEAGYEVNGVGSAREARDALENEEIPLLLSDVSMPDETGLDLVRFALCEHPETATLLISALEDPGIVAARMSLEDNLRVRTSALTEALTRLEGAAAQGRVLQGETIHRWAHSAEYRDPGIGRHLKRVGHYCALLAEKLGLHAESLELASVMHDVGKIAVPDSILLKTSPLTPDERLAVETHPTCGLSGAEIPLEGRIAAVADVFDALTSDRSYRLAWSPETTIAWMERESGKHFDPDVLTAFLDSMDEIESVRSLLS